MNIIINTPGGSVSFNIPVLKVQSYSLEQIFEKNLLFLLPFYIFNLENDFPKYDHDTKALERLKNIYAYFMNRLEKAVKEGYISAYYRRTILDMSKKVLENIAVKYKNLKEEVNNIMGGKVLEHEGKAIYNNGFAEGSAKGLARGISQEKERVATDMLRNGEPIEKIAKYSRLAEETIRNLAKSLGVAVM